jgi:predicted nucleotidyltransferase
MHSKINKILNTLIENAKKDSTILALLLFGSTVRKDHHRNSDTDICLVLMPRPYTPRELSQKKITYLKSFDLDIQILQQLPIYIRKRVIQEGKVLYCRDENMLYEMVFTVIREYADFEHIYREYLQEVAHAR